MQRLESKSWVDFNLPKSARIELPRLLQPAHGGESYRPASFA